MLRFCAFGVALMAFGWLVKLKGMQRQRPIGSAVAYLIIPGK